MFTIRADENAVNIIGSCGEDSVRRVEFDMSSAISALGPGVFTAVRKRPGDTIAYPAPMQEGDNGRYYWTITMSDTKFVGLGEVIVTFVPNSGGIGKSFIYQTEVKRSLTKSGGDVPDPEQSWVDHVIQVVSVAEVSASNAAKSAEAAKNSENAAFESKTQAKLSENAASKSAVNAMNSEQSASSSASSALKSANAASMSESAAARSASGAAHSASSAAESASQTTADALKPAADAKSVEENKSAVDAASLSVKQDADIASNSAKTAKASQEAAQISESNAHRSELASAGSAKTAEAKAVLSGEYASSAKQSETSAATSAQTASTSAQSAASDAEKAKAEVERAKAEAEKSEASSVRAEQAAQKAETIIDDSSFATDKTWSSRNIIKQTADRLAPLFHEKAPIVQGELVADYPLGVVSHIQPVQEGEGDPSPENVRPIHGHTEVNLTKCGDNLFHIEEFLNGLTAASGTVEPIASGFRLTATGDDCYTKSYEGLNSNPNIPVKKGDIIHLRWKVSDKAVHGVVYGFVYQALAQKWSQITNIGDIAEEAATFTATADGYFRMRFGIQKAGESNEFTEIQIGTKSALPYTAYKGETYTQQLQNNTVSGGFDWSTGELLTDAELVVLSPDAVIKDESNTYAIQVRVGDMKTLGKRVVQLASFYDMQFSWVQVFSTTVAYLYITKSRNPTITSVDVLRNLLQTKECMLVVPTKPIITKLAPHKIPALPGTTTLYSSTGDTEVTGRLDPNTVISGLMDRVAALEEFHTQI